MIKEKTLIKLESMQRVMLKWSPRTLRSLDTSLLTIPRFCLETYGRRSFSVFGPTVWNSLPLSLRKTQCFSTFKKKLKTYLFEKHLC